MQEKIYNKLVRDKIPKIIEKNGDDYKIYIADNKEYKKRLFDKLREEVNEFIETPCIEEMADILEVIDSLKLYYKFDEDKISQTKQEKFQKRGGFEKRIILEKVLKHN